nr:hypothetical protein GCM10020093_078340 [Planobispora longispora]
MPRASHPIGRRVAPIPPGHAAADPPPLRTWAIGAIAPNAAMLHAVNVPASPETKAKSVPAARPSIAACLAS